MTTTTLQHVVFPATPESEALPLYVDGGDQAQYWRDALNLQPGSECSFASYFNAFPASYWAHWTVVESVTLSLHTRGAGTVTVYRSNAVGDAATVETREVQGDVTTEIEIALTGFDTGGWLWFDLAAADTELQLVRGAWQTTATPRMTGKLSLGITTYNKPDYCIATLRNISQNAALCEVIDRVMVVDQGTKLVRDEADFAELQATLGEQLNIIEQGNLGGSGGFARAMAETLELDDSDFLLLLDDDVELETESALRALQFGRFSTEPTIVGGHMFNLLNKPEMHAWAEIVRPDDFMWQPSFKEQHQHDFSKASLRETPWMHQRLESEYNGWWMCMIPKAIIQQIGLPLPVFIKWDDAEYGLRAAAHGFSTVSLPGVGLWHVTWGDKDDTQDWQAFFHARNRVIAGLLHSERPKGGTLLQFSGRQDIKKLFNMQYYAVQLSVDGLRAVLDGPEALHASLRTAMPAARARAREFPETRVYAPGDPEAPVARRGKAPSHGGPRPVGPSGVALAMFTVKTAVRLAFRRGSEQAPAQPDWEYEKRDAFWWVIPSERSVIVSTGDGAGNNWFRFDRTKYRRLWRLSRRLTKQISAEWDRLASDYKRELPKITSAEAWRATFSTKE